jgi:1-acyl-sn-glycerol-3-phosphate acyltransferase
MRKLKAFVKLIVGVWHLLKGVWTIATRFPKASSAQRAQHIADWARGMLALLNVQLEIRGQPITQGPLMVVANHISWLDVLVMLAAQPVRFVSKAEVRHWPLIGWLATQAGTLYIERTSRRDALRVVHQVAAALQEGKIIAVFPEGTTTDGRSLLPFHGNLLQAAISVSSPVQAVALRFLDVPTQQISLSPAFVGDDSLLDSVWKMLTTEPVLAQLHFLPPQASAEQDRRVLAEQLQQQIAQILHL